MQADSGARGGAPALELRGICKRFGATVAVDDLSLSIGRGSVHALLGENGAGKSTTLKMLSGLVTPDSGTLLVNGREIALRTARDAHRAGIQTAFQELTLIPDLSVLENMVLPHPPRGRTGMVPWRKVAKRVASHFAALELDAPLHELAEALDLPVRQKIEIARALYREPATLLLDEPTSALSGRDVEWLGEIIARCRRRGITVVFITHRLPEVRAFCDRMTVLRNGRHILTGDLRDVDDALVVESIIGRSIDQTYPKRAARSDDTESDIVLALRGVSSGRALHEVDLTLRAGEIHGVAGLDGMGQKTLFDLCFGAAPVLSGTLEIDGQAVFLRSPADALHPAVGIGLVPEERKTEGLLLKLDGSRNASLPVIDRLTRIGLVDRRRELDKTRAAFAAVELDQSACHAVAGSFSGGNQQKIVIAKWLVAGSRILLLFDPTRGIDVGTKHQLYELMHAFTSDGGAVLFFSTEIPELVNLCDRVSVLYQGRIAGRFRGDETDEISLMNAVLGRGVETGDATLPT